MIRTSLLLVLSALAQLSCATTVTNENSPYYRMPVGTSVVLHQDITVPAGHARVFLQYGKVVAKHRLDTYYPHCNFEQRAVSDGTALINADRFRVTAVRSGEDLVVQREGLLHSAWRVMGEFDGISMVNLYIRHSISSPSQPHVVSFTCHGGFEFQGKALTPSLTDIRNVLGVVATVELP